MRRAIPDEGARPFEPQGILSALQRRGVRYVVIGGVGTILHGSPYPTADVDICPARDRPNLERLADALRDLDAKIYASELDEGLDRARDANMLERRDMWNLITALGRLDISFRPSGTLGFEDLVRDAVRLLAESSG